MNTNAIVSFIGIIPFVIALFIFLLYLLTRSRQKVIRRGLISQREILRGYQEESNRFRNDATLFSPSDPEPFGSLSLELNQQLTKMDQFILAAYRQYSINNQKAKYLNRASLKDLWHLPLDWQQLKAEVDSAWTQLHEIEPMFADALHVAGQIQGINKTLSKQCQDLMQQIEELTSLIKKLPEIRFDEEERLLLDEKINDWKATAVSQIPAFFFSTDDRLVAEKADKNTTSKVYRMLQGALPSINRLCKDIKKWHEQAIGTFANISRIQEKETIINGLMVDMMSNPRCAIRWSSTNVVLGEFKHEVDSISEMEKTRTHQAILVDYQKSLEILAKYEAVIGALYKIKEWRDEASLLWDTVELNSGREWAHRSIEMAKEVQNYYSGNWKKALSVQTIRGELEEILSLHQSVIPRDQANPVREVEIEDYWSGVKDLYDRHTTIRPRWKEILDRLNEIKQLDTACAEKLQQAQLILQKAIFISNSNPFLKRINPDLVKYDAMIKQSINGLNRSKEGNVEQKVTKANLLIADLENSFAKWVQEIVTENEKTIQLLKDEYASLSKTVSLDEPFVNQIATFLNRIKPLETRRATEQTGKQGLLHLSQELFKASELWQNIEASKKALYDVAKPVLERIKKGESSKSIAFEQLEKASKLMPEDLKWPPTTQHLIDERRQFNLLENEWNSLHQTKMQALILVGKLSDISERFQALSITLKQKIDQADSEQKKVRDYEEKLEESRNLWKRVIDTNSSNRGLKSDVGELLNIIDRDYNELKGRYEKGGLPYQQTIQSLRMLCRKVDDALMPFGGNQVIDINGTIQKRIY